ncbi:MAG: 16S rRNA (adenine(1518)-N(6)/adenine(1519)-N(6))-dimethyltransferase RsmA [Bacteroidia bacterium]|nr:16S rRNA (adenine(1518)-N(6)/adenine(1519)-N(6))-dimethyltransferase RsmA [Bacteroidia bacterium]
MPRYDQHFLRNSVYAVKIAEAVCPQAGEKILEVGPGRGALTRYLLQKGVPYIGIEIDSVCLKSLEELPSKASTEWILGDFLRIALPEEPLFFVSNLPYSISGPAIFRILSHHRYIRAGVVMLQAEVAQRLYAKAGKRPYGRLSVLFQSVYEVKRLCRVPPNAFTPPPKVWSEVVLFERKALLSSEVWEDFVGFVRRAFRQPRRKLAKNLSDYRLSISPFFSHRRPHELSVEEFFELWRILRNDIMLDG